MKEYKEKKGNIEYTFLQRRFLGIPLGKRYYLSSVEDMTAEKSGELYKTRRYRAGSLTWVKESCICRVDENGRHIMIGPHEILGRDNWHTIEEYDNDGLKYRETTGKGPYKIIKTYDKSGKSIKREEFCDGKLTEITYYKDNYEQKIIALANGGKEIVEYFYEGSKVDRAKKILRRVNADNHEYFFQETQISPNGLQLVEIRDAAKPTYYLLEKKGGVMFLEKNTIDELRQAYIKRNTSRTNE